MATSVLGSGPVAGVADPGSVRQIDPALAAAVEAAVRLTGADVAGLLLADELGDSAEMHVCAGRWTVHSVNLRVRRGHGLAGRILETRKPWKVDDYAGDRSIDAAEFARNLADDGTRAGLGAPMVAGDALLGVLMVWSRRPGAFDVAATQVLVSLADLAAAAVANGRRAERAGLAAAGLAQRCGRLDEQVAVLRDRAALRDGLTAQVLAHHELPALLGTVCGRTGGDAAVLDLGLGEIAASGTCAGARDRVAGHLRRAGAAADAVLPPAVGSPRWTVLRTVVAGDEPLARLVLCLPRAPGPGDHATATEAALACALHLTRERAVLDAVSQAHGDFVWQLLDGMVDEPVALVRARQLGCELPARLRVVVVPVGPADADEPDRGSMDVLVAAAERRGRTAGVRLVAGRRGGVLAMVVESGDDPAAARAVVEPLVRGLRQVAPGAVGAVGVSACVGWSADLRAAHRQARHALAAAALAPGGPAVLFDELGMLRFLLAPSDHADQLRFARAVLGPVIDYDREHRSDLVGTLGAYLDAGCSLTRAAAALYVHPKTVRYRLRRVQQLARRDLSGQHDRFDAHLAISILRALALDAGQDAEDPAGRLS
ncbi:MAG: helix-turn-helix domain-containing protein [Pseudonocardia sp.]